MVWEAWMLGLSYTSGACQSLTLGKQQLKIQSKDNSEENKTRESENNRRKKKISAAKYSVTLLNKISSVQPQILRHWEEPARRIPSD